MKQEHLFCAEVYHLLHKHMDHDRPRYFCLDGAAARAAAQNTVIPCATIPDLCFFFPRSTEQIRIEAKILVDRRVTLGRSQRHAWATQGHGGAKPHLWIGANEELTQFWMWEHPWFQDEIQRHQNQRAPILVFPKKSEPEPVEIKTLLKRVLDWAVNNHFKP